MSVNLINRFYKIKLSFKSTKRLRYYRGLLVQIDIERRKKEGMSALLALEKCDIWGPVGVGGLIRPCPCVQIQTTFDNLTW